MNYTLKELQNRVNQMIEQQGEDAHCAAWIYTKNDCHLKDEDGEIDYENNVEDADVLERIFDDVGNIDYIYQVIQECVDEVTEEQFMQLWLKRLGKDTGFGSVLKTKIQGRMSLQATVTGLIEPKP